MEDYDSNYNPVRHELNAISDMSLRRRNIPQHPKGFSNEWGALMQHQAEVQQLMEDNEK